MSASPSSAAATLEPAKPVYSPIVNNKLVINHLIAGFVWFTIALLAGLVYSMQLLQHYWFPGIEELSPGRVRLVHTNLIAFGFLTNGFIGMLYWTVPRLTGQRVLSDVLGWLIFWVWQLTILATWVGLHYGEAQAVEWGETPVWIDPVVCVGAVLVSLQFYTPIVRSTERSMYVSLWYFSAAFVWLGLTYIMGNFFPQYLVPGAGGGAMLGLYIHDLVGLWVTPMGWGLMYFFVPIILKTPIWSHALSLVGFWGLAFFYPLQGVHHFLWSPIPMFAQYGAVVSTIAVEIVVATVIINFFMTWLSGPPGSLKKSLPLRWFFVGALFYFITCLQCAFQVTLTFQKIIHFTDWVVGHAHLVMFGVFTFWMYGVLIHLWPKIVGRDWWSHRLNNWHFWLTTVALGAMFLDLMSAGVVQGFMWQALAPWEDSITASYPFWLLRSILGVVIIVAHVFLLVNMAMTTATSTANVHKDEDYLPFETVEAPKAEAATTA